MHNKLYFLGVYAQVNAVGATGDNVIGIKIRTLVDAALTTQVTCAVSEQDDKTYAIAYTFFRLPDTVNLTDIYVEVEFVSDAGTTGESLIHKVVCAPATYYNGLGWVWWPPHHTAADKSKVPLGHLTSIAVSNNNNGKFQTFFRRAYNIQLPTADSPTVNDALAGG